MGFVDIQDKYDAYGAAEFLCQPSDHESFSLVIMESWLCNRPVLVNGKCDVTKNFAIESKGGLYFEDYFEFEGVLKFYESEKALSSQMGRNGRDYVMSNFAWDVIVNIYTKYFQEVSEEIINKCNVEV